MKHLPALLLAVLTILRLWAAAVAPVTPGEAYQWMTANRLDWAFFDAPGGTAALVHASTLLLGDGPLGLRLAFPLLAAIASLGVYRLGRAWFGSATGLWAAIALNALPVFNLAAIHASPEMPTLTFLALSLWMLVRAFERGLPWWLLAGLALAGAAQFSYSAVAIVPGIFLTVSLCPRYRGQWLRPGLYFLVLLAGAGLTPAILWNQAYRWPAAALATWSTELTPQWSGIAPALFASMQSLSLPAAAAAIFALVTLIRSSRVHTRPRILVCLVAPFFLLWLRNIAHGDPATGPLLSIAILLGTGAASIFLETEKLRRLGAAALLLTAAVTAFTPPQKTDPWPAVAKALTPLLAEAQTGHRDPLFLIAPDPDATAAINYHLTRATPDAGHPVFLRESQDLSNQFGLWPRYDDFVPVAKAPDEYFQEMKAQNLYLGRSALYLTDEEPDNLPQTITSAFARVALYATLTLPGDRKLRVYLCEDYQTMPL